MSAIKSVVFASLIALAFGQNEFNQAGQQYGAAFKNIGDLFIRQYKTAQDFVASSRPELERKVDDMIKFLDQLKANMYNLMADASTRNDFELQRALNNVESFAQDVYNFQSRLRITTQPDVTQLQLEWKEKTITIYNDCLNKIIKTAEAAKGGCSTLQKNLFLLSTAIGFFIAKIIIQ